MYSVKHTWTSESMSLPVTAGNQGKVISTDGTTIAWNALGGDIAGPIGSATVTQIQGCAVSSAAPRLCQTLVWNATTNRWEPQTLSGTGGFRDFHFYPRRAVLRWQA